VVGDTFLDDNDRTDLADAGINVIQNISGTGIAIKNFFTPSTTKEFKFANGILMREFIKISVVDSLADTENEPNSYERIQNSRSAVVSFMNRLWRVGSTGNVPTGETFGQTIDPETGQGSSLSDHFQVQADIINNPQASIEAGERDIDIWFTYPSPAGSIKIGVGLMLLGN
jgi:phage tail sheath protein FI